MSASLGDGEAVPGSANSSPAPPPVTSSCGTPGALNITESDVLPPDSEVPISGQISGVKVTVPSIPNLPSPLMVPPVPFSRNVSRSSTATSDSLNNVGSTSTGSPLSRPGAAVGRSPGLLHHNLDSIRLQVGQQSNMLQGLQSQLASKAQEVDQLRDELSQFDRDITPTLQPPKKALHRTSDKYGSASGGVFQTNSLVPRAGVGMFGVDYAAQESAAELEDLRMKLKMTTELCAKQDGYYRGVVSELEDKLNDTIAGRDQILALREGEAASQLQLIHQLEAALRQQKHEAAAKDEALYSLETQLRHSDESFSLYKSWFSRITQILHDEEHKRGRPGLRGPRADNGQAAPILGGDAVIGALQNTLSENDTQARALGIKLERVEEELAKTKEEMKQKHDELLKEHKHKVESFNEEHARALNSATVRAADSLKQLENLQTETALLKKQHETEITAMDNKARALELEMGKASGQKEGMLRELQEKCKETEISAREMKSELEMLKGEKERLMADLSQEKANLLAAKEKLLEAKQKDEDEMTKNEALSAEIRTQKETAAKEIATLRTELEQRGVLLNELREQAEKRRLADVESTVKEEREKSNARLDGILTEFNKLNSQLSELRGMLDEKGAELTRCQDDYNKMKDNSELREKDLAMMREDKMALASKAEDLEKQLNQSRGELAGTSEALRDKTKSYETAESLIVKLKAQLEERDKTITTFQEQGVNMAEILERNSEAGNSLQREREQLILTLQERISQVEEMKSHREILAKKLKAKERRLRELETEVENSDKSRQVSDEKLAALMDERENLVAELKRRQLEQSKVKEQRDSLSALIEGKDGVREKEIGKLLSRLKGSEADLALTRKLLKAKGEVSGKAVRVAESMQKEVTAKRGEVDSLCNKIHWLKENLEAVSKDAQYYERKSKELAEELKEVTLQRDQLNNALQQSQAAGHHNLKRAKHLDQALEKAALKHADAQAVIERLEQDIARLKLKHSLEIKELERNRKAGAVSVRADSVNLADLLNRLNTLRLPAVSNQTTLSGAAFPAKEAAPPELPCQLGVGPTQAPYVTQSGPQAGSSHRTDENLTTEDLRTLLLDVRTLLSTFQAPAGQTTSPSSSHDPPERGPSGGAHTREGAREGGPSHEHLEIKGAKEGPSQYVENEQHLRTEGRAVNCRGERQTSAKRREESARQSARVGHVKPVRHRIETGSIVSGNDTETDFGVESALDNSDKENSRLLHRRPLHSSSPKRETRRRPFSASTSFDSDDSDVTSLLLDQSSVDTVVTRDGPISGASSASSRVSSRRSACRVRSDAGAGSSVPVAAVRDNHPWKTGDDVARRREARLGYRSEFGARRIGSSSRKGNEAGETEAHSSHKRAEMILKSLTNTGDQLTKKNKEIHKLLREQDKRLRRCRENELGIQALLT